MAVTSDASPFTSVTASPLESRDADDVPIELKVPLPPSSSCSDEVEEREKHMKDTGLDFPGPNSPEDEGVQQRVKQTLTDPHERVTRDDTPSGLLGSPAITLEELAHLAQLECYQRRRMDIAQSEVEKLILLCGLERRLISTLSIAYGNMIDQYKTDDQAGFAGLYEACEKLKISCDLTDCDTVPSKAKANLEYLQGDDRNGPFGIHVLSPCEQEHIITFLNRIRTESSFLADKISQLSPPELMALTSSYHPAGIDFSILQNHSHGKSHFFSKDSQMMKLSRRMDNIHCFHNQDPFFALLYGVFDSSARPGSQEYVRRMNIWSTTCARNMIDGFGGSRPGSDEFAIASLDAFASFQDWILRPKMELYIMKVLVEGSFLLEPSPLPYQPVNFSEPLETQNARVAVAEAEFFEKAMIDLFDLLTAERNEGAAPASVLTFAHAVLDQIEDPKLRARSQQFIVIRWYFATFLSSIIVYPELHGILMTHHIGETARRLILQKLVVKMQERVFEVILPSNSHAFVNPRIGSKISSIFQSFSPRPLPKSHELPSEAPHVDQEASTRFLMLTPLDIVGLIQTLCPHRNSAQSLNDMTSPDPISDRPSTAGSSTLVAGSSDVGSTSTVPTPPTPAGVLDSAELPTDHPPAGGDQSQDKAQGEFGRQTTIKEASPKEVESQLKITCRKLKDAVARDKDHSSFCPADTRTFLYYSRDSSRLSVGPPEVDSHGGAFPESSIFQQHDDFPHPLHRSEIHKGMGRAIVALLNETDSFRLETVELACMSEREPSGEPFDPLETLMKLALDRSRSNLDSAGALIWWTHLQAYREYLMSDTLRSSSTLLRDLYEDFQYAVGDTAKMAKEREVQRRSLDLLHERQRTKLAKMAVLRNALRVKMWYTSDVRHSATYDEALYVTRALRAMTSSKKPKQPGSISNWARQRLRGANLHDRAEAQTLDAIVAMPDHGGLNKLADEQVDLTSRWLTRKSIENFCKGEERIHRFCFEIQRTVGKIAGTSLLESPVLWSSNLFKREKASFDSPNSKHNVIGSPVNPYITPPVLSDYGRSKLPASNVLQGHSRAGLGSSVMSPTSSYGGFWSQGQPMRQSTGLGLYAGHPILPPTPTSPPMSWSSSPVSSGSPLHASSPLLPPHTGPSGGGGGLREGASLPAKKVFTEEIEEKLRSLLISDLGYLLWNHGSETDVWVNEHITDVLRDVKSVASGETTNNPLLNADEARKLVDTSHQNSVTSVDPSAKSPLSGALSELGRGSKFENLRTTFPFSDSYASLLQRMSLTPDPYAKFALLYELEGLILQSMATNSFANKLDHDGTRPSRPHSSVALRSKSVPRTKATSLEEVIANCTERRAGTLKAKGPQHVSVMETFGSTPTTSSIPGTDDVVDTLLAIMQNSKIRPKTLFRDLQYIAAFVPAESLDHGARGKAFWDVGLSALALKDDLCESMIKRANTITAYHISPDTSLDIAVDTRLTSTTLRDAAALWLITAKEGSPVAARELGLLYLTHPVLIPRVTMPFALAKDVFKSVMSSESRAGDKERGALDPCTFAVVFHWMEIAANGGDKDAKDFLKENGAFSSGR